MTTDLSLRCACCCGALAECEAAPAPGDTPTEFRYHADFRACVRVALANLAAASPVMRAMLGAEEGIAKVGITCSACGLPFEVVTDDHIVACPFCGHATFSPGALEETR